MRAAVRSVSGQAQGVDTDEIFLSMIEEVTLDVVDRIGDDREARYQFFRRLVDLAKEIAPGPEDSPGRAN
jgi:hypothetical protein